MSKLFAGQNLVKSDCQTPVDAKALEGKVVAIYFRYVWSTIVCKWVRLRVIVD